MSKTISKSLSEDIQKTIRYLWFDRRDNTWVRRTDSALTIGRVIVSHDNNAIATDNHVKTFQCIPLFVDYFVSELDSIQNTTKLCSKSDKIFEQKFREKCLELCPKECLREEYSYRIKESDPRSGIDDWLRQDEISGRLYSKSIEWDESEPMFAYTEDPVMSLSDYLVNCGGLMGLWFGTSAKDIITFIIENEFIKKLTRLIH